MDPTPRVHMLNMVYWGMMGQIQYWDPFKCVWNDDSQSSQWWHNGITDKQKTEPGPWKRVREGEWKKMISMSMPQLFDYIKLIVDSRWRIEAHFSWILKSDEIFRVSGSAAAAEYKQTITSILVKLKSYLEGKTSYKK